MASREENILLSTSQYRPWFSGKLLREKTALAKPVLPLGFFSSHSSVILRLLFVEKILPLQRA